MSNKIDGFNGVAGTPATLPTQVGGARGNTARDPVAQAAEIAPVSLSKDAMELRDLQASVQSASDVDEARVEAIRASIANGSYRIDADRIASRLLDLEKQLPK